MRINCEIDTAELILRTQNGQRRLAYAVVNAINTTAKRVQSAGRQRVREEFTVRKREFMERQAAVIKPFASVKAARPFADIAVGQKPRLLLPAYERGAKREPMTPRAKSVAVPLTGRPARPSFKQSVPQEFTFKGLKLIRVKGKRGRRKRDRVRSKRTGPVDVAMRRTAAGQWKGSHRTFMLPRTRKAPLGGVFQRVGPGRDDIRMIYSFRRDIRLGRRLSFVDTARREAARWFREEVQRETMNAIARARGRGL